MIAIAIKLASTVISLFLTVTIFCIISFAYSLYYISELQGYVSVISSLLIPIVKLWIRSQAECLETISIAVGGSSWQVLQGKIPTAQVEIENVVYQGIYITRVELCSGAIHLNVPELIKGKPLKLIQPIQVEMNAFMDNLAVRQSLESNLFRTVTTNLLANSTSLNYHESDHESDRELEELLHEIVKNLGDQFQLQKLAVESGAVICQGIFPIHAT